MKHPQMNGTKDSHLGKGVSTHTSTHTSKSTSDAQALNDQTQSQMQEINMFAAMANADVNIMDDLNSMNENADQEDSLEDSHQNDKESDATGVLRDDNDNDNRSGDASAPKSPNIKSKRAHNRRASNIDISTNANTDTDTDTDTNTDTGARACVVRACAYVLRVCVCYVLCVLRGMCYVLCVICVTFTGVHLGVEQQRRERVQLHPQSR